MAAKTYDVDLSHSGADNSGKNRGEQEGGPVFLCKNRSAGLLLWEPFCLAPRSNVVIKESPSSR